MKGNDMKKDDKYFLFVIYIKLLLHVTKTLKMIKLLSN